MKYFNYINANNSKSDKCFSKLINYIKSSTNVSDVMVHPSVKGNELTISFFTSDGTYQNELIKIQSDYDRVVLRYISNKFSDNFGEVIYTGGNQKSSFNKKCLKSKFEHSYDSLDLSEYHMAVYKSIGNAFTSRVNKQ